MLCKRAGDALGSRIEVTTVELHLFELRTLSEAELQCNAVSGDGDG